MDWETPSRTRLIKAWGDEAVVYDTLSGDTHYLKPLTFALYQICREHPGYTADQAGDALAARLKTADPAQVRELAEDVLAQLHQIGLLQSP
ncbi:MAG: HPr-rel-A system PqqD family protein [Hydrogenophilales bacterium 16-64-46]|nr:MAG: HPr-rel-A system PqqD family protein [Hydrogenophilales bacterium 12-64-13]OYZ05776.1 MAG: HPr-rel-A system PqqD family protein [Hydrogenophilales bacterium 16-64-46]OZA39711.1 MAG: HPr-rel-A system PqqD family protein [Hydrogenophilales bacterium 17-64-34]HQS98753.1 HPr-rel-A system PqqD family peptide chaperone [Thiobacillus sp.]